MRRTDCESRAVRGRAGARSAPERGGERVLGALELAIDIRLRREREQRVVVAVRGELVALVADPAHQLGVGLGVAAEHEERRTRVLAQRVEHGRRSSADGPSSKVSASTRSCRPASGDDAAEERRSWA